MKPLSLPLKILVAFILPFAAGYYYLVLPQIKAVGEGLSAVDSLQQSGVATLSVKQRDAFKAQIDTVRARTQKLLPATDEQYDLSVQVESLAKSKGMTLTALTISSAVPTTLPKTTPAKDADTAAAPVVSTSSLLKVTVAVGVSGSYEAVQSFIAGLTMLDRFMQVDQATFTVTPASGQIGAQVTAFGYYLPKS
jgi:Tfp pilus assembly protein PilO